VRQRTPDRPLRQRILALATAYVVTLSGFVASGDLARATADAAGVAGGVICHDCRGGSGPHPRPNRPLRRQLLRRLHHRDDGAAAVRKPRRRPAIFSAASNVAGPGLSC
jgi:hypothetical protein